MTEADKEITTPPKPVKRFEAKDIPDSWRPMRYRLDRGFIPPRKTDGKGNDIEDAEKWYTWIFDLFHLLFR